MKQTNSTADKTVIVERSQDKEYVHLNNGLNKINSKTPQSHVKSSNTSALCLLVIYLASGSDYIASFHNITHNRMLSVFFTHCNFISTEEDPFVKVDTSEHGKTVVSLSDSAFVRFMCCVYLEKYDKLYKHRRDGPSDLFNAFVTSGSNMSTDMRSLLEWLDYKHVDGQLKINTLSEFSKFTRRVCYCYSGSGLGQKTIGQRGTPTC